MRSLIILLAGLFTVAHAAAQHDSATSYRHNNPFIYAETGFSLGPAHEGLGGSISGQLGLNLIFDQDRILSVYYSAGARVSAGVPDDYDPGLFGTKPLQTFNMLGVCYGRVFYSGGSPLVRYVLKGGAGAGIVSTPVNFVKGNSAGWFGPSYTYDTRKQFTAGLLLCPTVEFPLGRAFGMTVGIFSYINPVFPIAGLEYSLLFGKVRNRRPVTKPATYDTAPRETDDE